MGRNRGFSLIEILVVLGIIGILSSFITPKVMNYTAKAKDVKAVSVLESLRTASELRYLETGKTFSSDADGKQLTNDDIKELGEYLSDNINTLIEKSKELNGETSSENFLIEIGGSKESKEGEATYGGTIGFTTTAPTGKTSDGIKIWLVPQSEVKEYNLNGEKWIDL